MKWINLDYSDGFLNTAFKNAYRKAISKMITGDETGLIKVVHPLGTKSKTYCFGKQSRVQSVKSVFRVGDDNATFSVVRSNGIVEYWRAHYETEVNLGLIHEESLTISNLLGGSRLESYKCAVFNGNGDLAILSPKFDEDNNESTTGTNTFTLEGNVTAMSSDLRSQFCYGGKENDIKVVDVNSMETVWKAKNVPNDNLNLRVPIWIKALQMSEYNENGSHMITSGTAYRHIRLYDTRESQRPVQSITTEEEYPITALLSLPSSPLVYAGNGAGNLFQYDMRNGKRTFTLHSCRGSIRAIDKVGEKFIAVAGLDRYLHIYNKRSNKFVEKYYLKNRINSILALETHSVSETSSDDEDFEEETSDPEAPDRLKELTHSDDDDDDDDDYESDEESATAPSKRPRV